MTRASGPVVRQDLPRLTSAATAMAGLDVDDSKAPRRREGRADAASSGGGPLFSARAVQQRASRQQRLTPRAAPLP
jgi:hypothetical protein